MRRLPDLLVPLVRLAALAKKAKKRWFLIEQCCLLHVCCCCRWCNLGVTSVDFCLGATLVERPGAQCCLGGEGGRVLTAAVMWLRRAFGACRVAGVGQRRTVLPCDELDGLALAWGMCVVGAARGAHVQCLSLSPRRATVQGLGIAKQVAARAAAGLRLWAPGAAPPPRSHLCAPPPVLHAGAVRGKVAPEPPQEGRLPEKGSRATSDWSGGSAPATL